MSESRAERWERKVKEAEQRRLAAAADLERLRRLSVRIFDECGECEGDGIGHAWPDDPGTEPHPCPSCDSTGRVLRDGAWVSPNPNAICFPASWMEEA